MRSVNDEPRDFMDLIRMISDVKSRLLGRQTCDMCRNIPHKKERADVRIKIAETFDWHYYCEEHSKWPWQDRSEWEPRYQSVERWDLNGGGWIEWTDYAIHTPWEKRAFSTEEIEEHRRWTDDE